MCRMVTYPLSNLSDDEGDDVEKGEIKNDGKSQGCSPSVDEEDEDWEQEIMQLNNLRPYGM